MSEESSFPKERAFTEAEYARRLKLIRESMDHAGLEVLLLFDPSNICYLAGHHSMNLWDYQCLIVPLDSNPCMVLWHFETGRFQASSWLEHAETFQTHEDPVVFTAQTIRKLGLPGKHLGTETRSRYLPAQVHHRLSEALGGTPLRDGSGLVESGRVVKSAEELAKLREAARITSQAMSAALERVREEVSDQEVAAEASRTLISGGSGPPCIEPIVAVGHRAGLAHSNYNGTKIQRGDPAFIELGACVDRYTAPLMRTAVVGTVSPHIQKMSDFSLSAVDALIEAIRPGVRACDVARKGLEAIAPVESEVVFHYVFGYSVGLGFPPSWLEQSNFFLGTDNPQELRPGMVFHLPITLRVFGRYGVGFSETVLVTPTGCEVLTHVERKLVVH